MVKKNKIWSLLIITFSAIFGIIGCKDDGKRYIDTTGHEVEIKIKRFEKELIAVRNSADYFALDVLDSLFIMQFKQQIMVDITGEGRIPAVQSAEEYVRFASNEDIQHLYQSVEKKYPTMEQEEDQLSDAFSIFHTVFPKRPIPRIMTFISPFNAAHATTDETLGIGLDMYLGPEFEPYASPGIREKFPQYKLNRCRKDYIVPNTVKSWLLKEFEIDNTDRRLINQMIYEGKILYALDICLPNIADSLKIGYQKGKIEWCKQNEVNIWDHIIQNDLLYSNEYQKFSGILADGPFSKGVNVPNESPPMIAIWAGWQIVRKYMAKHPEITLEALMLEADAEKILKESGYKP